MEEISKPYDSQRMAVLICTLVNLVSNKQRGKPVVVLQLYRVAEALEASA